MQTDTIMAFQIEDGDYIKVGESVYFVTGEPSDADDGLLFDVREEDDEQTQLWFGPFDTLSLVTSFEDESDEVVDVEEFVL